MVTISSSPSLLRHHGPGYAACKLCCKSPPDLAPHVGAAAPAMAVYQPQQPLAIPLQPLQPSQSCCAPWAALL